MKKLLIIVRKVDREDVQLGFFHGWIRAFAERFDQVTVIGLGVGTYHLSDNVRILSLGEETGKSKLKYLINFFRYIIKEREHYDAVFVHASPQYVVLGAWLWKLMKKKISLWYAHGSVNRMLKVAELWTDVIFTSTPEGFRLKSHKTQIVGQGIDTELFIPGQHVDEHTLKIVTVGRISAAKDFETLIQALALIRESKPQVVVEIFGGTIMEKDRHYFEQIKNLIAAKNLAATMKFMGPIANQVLPAKLQSADLFVNMSHTGSLDKAILEAMACGLPVLTCNEALEDVLGHYKDLLMYPKKDFRALAEKIQHIAGMTSDDRKALSSGLRDIVVKHHNLPGLVERVKNILFGHAS